MANTIDFNVNTNAVTVLNQTGAAAENTAKGFKSAKQELRELQNKLLEMDQTSEEFKKASKRAAELKDTISDLGAEINANAGNAFEGLSNNVSLFGSRLMSLDLKGAGQALTGMGNAVSRIDFKTLKDEVGGLVQGFGNLAKALLSNPILLLAGAIAGAIIYFDELKTIFEDLTMSADRMNKRLAQSQQVIEEVGKAKVVTENIKLLSKVVNDHTKSEEDRKKALDKLNIAFKANNIQTVDNINNTDTLTKSTDTLITKLVKEAEVRGKMAYLQELYAKKTKLAAESAQGVANSFLLSLELTARTSNNLQAKFAAGVVDVFSSSTLSDIENISNQIKLVEDNILSSSEAISQIDISGAIPPPPPEPPKVEKIDINEQNAIRAAKELKLERELADAKLKVQQDYIHANQGAQANELYDLENKKQLELQTYEGAEEDKVYIIDKYRLAEIDINTKYDDLALEQQLAANEKKKTADEKAKEDELAREKQLAADKLAAEQALMDAKFSLASASVNLLGTLFAKNKKAADIAFALDKSLAIAQVIVNTQREISAYNANPVWSLSPDGGASIKIPAIIGAKLRAAASIAAIAGTAIGRFAGGGGGNNNAGSNGGGGGTMAPSPANFAFLGNQPNQQPPLQAYIVGTQVSSNLEAQQLIQNQSRLGG